MARIHEATCSSSDSNKGNLPSARNKGKKDSGEQELKPIKLPGIVNIGINPQASATVRGAQAAGPKHAAQWA